MDERRWHNIKPNEVTRIPHRHVFVDTEARREYDRGVEKQEWRCAVGIFAERQRDGEYKEYSRDYLSAEDLWRDVSDFTSSKGRTVVWCHNLAYDIRIGSVFEVLPQLGWALRGHNIASRGTWLEWRRNDTTLILCDSFSVFPTSIERIGQWISIGKPSLPFEDSGMDDWLNRCRADVRILATAILGYLRWLKDEDMGNWQLTGNAQAWAGFRHKFLTHKLTVHSDEEALRAERRAMWAGRCEAYWHGKISDMYVYEYDFVRAYPTIARDYEIPIKLLGVLDTPEMAWNAMGKEHVAVLVECDIETSVPVVPAESEGRILWPVGRFSTVLWDVEVRAAIGEGATVEIRRAWAYRTAPALRSWGEWILTRLDLPDETVPVWQKSILKHWSRALIGRMAMSYQKWEYDGEMFDSRVEGGWIKDERDGSITEYVQIGTGMWLHAGKEEWKHSMPMITGYIQSVARVLLWDVIRAMPTGSVLYADTDSVFITEIDREAIEDVISAIPQCTLRVKSVWQGIEIYGPRQIITGTEVRIAGIPKRAERVERQKFKGEVWESLGMAIAMGRVNAVQVRDRHWLLAGIDNRRKATDNGFTEAIEIQEW